MLTYCYRTGVVKRLLRPDVMYNIVDDFTGSLHKNLQLEAHIKREKQKSQLNGCGRLTPTVASVLEEGRVEDSAVIS